MKRVLTILCFLLTLNTYSQCVGTQSSTITPAGPYSPGDVVTVNYTLSSFTQINVNWIHAFEINLGSGWIQSSIITSGNPGNPGGSLGGWFWDNQHTFPSGLNFGPGWRFIHTIAPNWGTNSVGPFYISFTVTVKQTCTAENLSVAITVYGDCQTGGWFNGACCNDPAYSIYQGNVQVLPITTSNISHY